MHLSRPSSTATHRWLPALLLACAANLLAAAGTALAAEFPADRLLVASEAGSAVLSWDAALQSSSPLGAVSQPAGLAFGADGLLYISSADTDRVLILDAKGAPQGSIGGGSSLSNPAGLAFGARGELWVTSRDTDQVLHFDAAGLALGSVGPAAGVSTPVDVAVTPDGHLLVASSGNDAVLELDPSGALVRTLIHADLASPGGVALGADGSIYVSSSANHRVLVFAPSGSVSQLGVGSGLDTPQGLCFGRSGHLLVVSSGSDEVFVFNAAGAVHATYDAATGVGRALAVSPWRFDALIKGTLETDEGLLRIKDNARMSLWTWSPTVLLDVTGGDLEAHFGNAHLALSGHLAWEDPEDNKRSLSVALVDGEALEQGVGSLSLSLKSRVKKKTGRLELKAAAGSLLLSGEAGVFNGVLKTRKPLK